VTNQHELLVVPTRTANLASVLAGLRRAGAEPRLAGPEDNLEEARRLVLPGVGTFGAAMAYLEARGLVGALRSHLETGKPALAICLGLQLLFEESEESPGVRGLGLVPGEVRRFTDVGRIPQMGWNELVPAEDEGLLERGYAYFANSYAVMEAPRGWQVAWSDYGRPFVAAMEQGNLLACQFHPELSSKFGLALLRRWLERTAPGQEGA
jgi:imidazole glycerol-phosphate synthase subunit HisH